ncbi:helix-turn-helix transcriptional regulator [Kibdelosporangium phytohabitans]|uniref:XRE family transcriptional regulator n=1 Tax=Kibdelosporangium phytohabitans TaxID=860235 RepID=A0A0N9HLJ6_9PSEU|nr:helix-turn-helix transcriptional regulator [Kibdelosporangium phytohabitans]ALG07137.1 XRE family transcriptional regulator [Kibdelosporangium phytohabitans]MBE1468462.1 transcriptional regulator with XRE-family HTH domain [Kibdelosporangium phytohabitans]
MTSTLPPGTARDVRRDELAAFLRNRRERITPEEVGLPPGGRRRTPGLRREEVAQLAGVGVTWYTWLEQGRDIQASDQVLQAVADTLRLDPHERAHMFTLAGSPRPVAASECDALSPQMHVIMRHIEPLPAAVLNSRMDILAANRSYTWLFDLDQIPFEDRNTLLLAFTYPAWRARLVDRADSLPRIVAQFRASMVEHMSDNRWKCLVSRMREESPEFEALWVRHDVRWIENLTKRFDHPEAGRLEFHYTNLWFGPRSETRLTTYTPAGDDTWAKLRDQFPTP